MAIIAPKKCFFHHTSTESASSLPLCGRDLALPVEGMMKNRIHNTGSKKECLKVHVCGNSHVL